MSALPAQVTFVERNVRTEVTSCALSTRGQREGTTLSFAADGDVRREHLTLFIGANERAIYLSKEV
ncbi:MAG: hypothetical protein ACTS6G_04150 [Candidatus Hodgkinia cicadicola]